ncbi:hypothetical protein D0N36_09575 [Hymenobacter lapidiphilus]|uniref:hypothetical protein n=1 Tax=Hymenobacter sp. CCM 8763 TaxID=2303334 RepID=UPI000E350D5F|nr:hypothetical protein [Hymenobacter sp. CCM 8763]RFP65301.1 hypothetical protein D0N36_09575 [Hymenobacter sp. CCM 8763]
MATEIIFGTAGYIAVPKVELELRRWAGEPTAYKFGNKPLIDFGGRPLFAELCGYELFLLSGWDARWVQTFGANAKGPKLFTAWEDVLQGQQQDQPLPNEGLYLFASRNCRAQRQ